MNTTNDPSDESVKKADDQHTFERKYIDTLLYFGSKYLEYVSHTDQYSNINVGVGCEGKVNNHLLAVDPNAHQSHWNEEKNEETNFWFENVQKIIDAQCKARVSQIRSNDIPDRICRRNSSINGKYNPRLKSSKVKRSHGKENINKYALHRSKTHIDLPAHLRVGSDDGSWASAAKDLEVIPFNECYSRKIKLYRRYRYNILTNHSKFTANHCIVSPCFRRSTVITEPVHRANDQTYELTDVPIERPYFSLKSRQRYTSPETMLNKQYSSSGGNISSGKSSK